MNIIELAVILLPHEISEALEILSHLVPLNLLLDLKFSLDVIDALSMIDECVFCELSKLDCSLLIDKWISDDRSIFYFGQITAIIFQHGCLGDG